MARGGWAPIAANAFEQWLANFLPRHPPALDLGGRERAIRPRAIRVPAGLDAGAPAHRQPGRRGRVHGGAARHRRHRQPGGEPARAARRDRLHAGDAVGLHAGSIRATAPTCGCRCRRTTTRAFSLHAPPPQAATSVLGLLLRNAALRLAAGATHEFAGPGTPARRRARSRAPRRPRRSRTCRPRPA